MAVAATFEVEKRDKLGSAEARRLRRRNMCPGNLYGGGKDPLAFAVSQDQVRGLLNTGTRIVDISLGGQSAKALVRELQWDVYSTHVTHIDLLRVDATQRVDVEVSLEPKGVAPGVIAGGKLVQSLRRLELNCTALEIPEAIQIPINDLEIGDTVTLADLNLGEDVTIELPLTTTILQIEAPSEESDEDLTATESGPVEPEVIGKSGDAGDDS
ncbi:MAG: 50S ribosomal protein L25 [Planctomycetaceae bacterium]